MHGLLGCHGRGSSANTIRFYWRRSRDTRACRDGQPNLRIRDGRKTWDGRLVNPCPLFIRIRQKAPSKWGVVVFLSADQHSSLSAFTSRASPESSFGDRVDSHRDGIIPEHYLYIPPLRLGTSTEEGRPVPALQQAGDDNDQVSVR